MPHALTRRRFVYSAAAAAVAAGLPRRARAGIEDIPRSPYGFDTTAEEVAAGVDLAGKTVLITGCNSGLGLESMRVLAARGAHVLGAARTREKAETACAGVGGRATPLVCELTDFDSIVSCADEVAALDIRSTC